MFIPNKDKKIIVLIERYKMLVDKYSKYVKDDPNGLCNKEHRTKINEYTIIVEALKTLSAITEWSKWS